MLSMKVGKCSRKERSKTKWMDCVRIDNCIKSVDTEMTAERRMKKKRSCFVDFT